MHYLNDRTYIVLALSLALLTASAILFFSGPVLADEVPLEDQPFITAEELFLNYPQDGGGDMVAMADSLGVTVEELEEALVVIRTSVVEEAVDAGTMDEAEAEAVLTGVSLLPPDVTTEMVIDQDDTLAEALDIPTEAVEEAGRKMREKGNGKKKGGGKG